MEDTHAFKYEYALPHSPQSDRLVINMDGVDASDDALAATGGDDQSNTTPTAAEELPSFDTFNMKPPEPDIFQYQYTLPYSPQSGRLRINLDGVDASGNELAATGETNQSNTTTPSTSEALRSFDTLNRKSPEPFGSWWYKVPSENDTVSNASEVLKGVQAELPDAVPTTGQADIGEKQEKADRSFHVENILGTEQHYETPRHSTPVTSPTLYATRMQGYQPPTYESIYSNHMIGTRIAPSAGNHLDQQTTQSFVLQSSHNVPPTQITGRVKPYTRRVYKRHTEKPPYSYACLAVVAILSSKEKELTLAGIREKLMSMFPFFRGDYVGWKNSLRHVLSNSKCFFKVEENVEQGSTSKVSFWKVNHEFIKPSIFIRSGNEEVGNRRYKLTIQEELGLPPTFGVGPLGDLVAMNDIRLPKKPSFQPEFSPLVGGDDDFLNGRNDVVSTPQSTISDIESVQGDLNQGFSINPPKKRRRTEETYTAQRYDHLNQYQMSSTSAMNSMYYDTNMYSSDSVRLHDPAYNFYQANAPNAPIGQQMSRDWYYYGNQQQTTPYAQPWNFWGYNDATALRHWWLRESMYYGMGTSSVQPSHRANNTSWFQSANDMAEAPLNLAKSDRNLS